MKIPGPAYRIITPRLVLRCYEPADAEKILNALAYNREHLLPWMVWAKNEPVELQVKIDQARQWRAKFDNGQDFIYGVFTQDETRIIGGTGLHTRVGSDAREIGYWIDKDFINQGLATELSAALTKVAFEVEHVKYIEIHCSVDNIRSASVPRKLGYTHEGNRRKLGFHNDGQTDQMIWSMFAEDYPNSPCAQMRIEAYDAAGRRIL